MNFYILLFSFFTAAFSNTSEIDDKPIKTTVNITENSEQQNMLIGKFSKEDFQKDPYASWFNRGYESYEPSAEAMEIIKKNISEYEIVVLMGTWCPDSRREVPQLLKLLDLAGYDSSKLTLIGVNRAKATPDNLEKQWNLERVPTFIFLKDGKEVNRYVEYARESLEKDISKIISSKEYSHSYAD